jgi:hypothetical protein
MVAVFTKTEKLGQVIESWRSSSVNRIRAAAATTDKTARWQRDRGGMDGGCLVDDGDINIKTLSDRVILQCEPHSGGGCNERLTRQDRQQDRQEQQGVDRGHLDKDGDININIETSSLSGDQILQYEQHLVCGCNDSSDYIKSRTKPARQPASIIRSGPWLSPRRR